MQEIPDYLLHLEVMIRVAALGVFGGVAKYLHDVSAGKKEFTWFSLGTFCLLAAFSSNVLHEFIPADTKGRDGYIMLAGYFCMLVISASEKKVASMIYSTGSKKKNDV